MIADTAMPSSLRSEVVPVGVFSGEAARGDIRRAAITVPMAASTA